MLDRFMEKISPEPNTGCWLWVAHVKKVVGFANHVKQKHHNDIEKGIQNDYY